MMNDPRKRLNYFFFFSNRLINRVISPSDHPSPTSPFHWHPGPMHHPNMLPHLTKVFNTTSFFMLPVLVHHHQHITITFPSIKKKKKSYSPLLIHHHNHHHPSTVTTIPHSSPICLYVTFVNTSPPLSSSSHIPHSSPFFHHQYFTTTTATTITAPPSAKYLHHQSFNMAATFPDPSESYHHLKPQHLSPIHHHHHTRHYHHTLLQLAALLRLQNPYHIYRLHPHVFISILVGLSFNLHYVITTIPYSHHQKFITKAPDPHHHSFLSAITTTTPSPKSHLVPSFPASSSSPNF